MDCGIVGLTGSGKTCLFKALTGGHATQAPAGRPNVGMAPIPDQRLEVLGSLSESKKITPATINFVDIPGTSLEHVRQVDALCEVVRCFDAAGPVDPIRDITALADEFILADLALVESALDKAKRAARGGDAETRARAAVLEKVLATLTDGRPARDITDWTDAERVLIRGYGLISAKSVLYVANVGENDLGGDGDPARLVHEHAAADGGQAVAVCAGLEAELAEMDEADRAEMLEGLGLAEPAIGLLARAVCRLLKLAVFYTTGPKETRAWTVAEAATAPEAAAVIHTDMERGFIRAECYSFDDMVEHKSEKAIKAAGKMRVEGKGYHIHDGDVMRVLFNV